MPDQHAESGSDEGGDGQMYDEPQKGRLGPNDRGDRLQQTKFDHGRAKAQSANGIRLYDAMKQQEADFVIGAREFGEGHVPLRSRIGNVLTISLSALLLGTRVRDTQSGYRILSRRFLEDTLPSIKGGRYETEMELLGKAIGGGYKVASVPIQTIYEEGNVSSHFHKIRDSYLIYRTLFATAWKARIRKR